MVSCLCRAIQRFRIFAVAAYRLRMLHHKAVLSLLIVKQKASTLQTVEKFHHLRIAHQSGRCADLRQRIQTSEGLAAE